VSWLDSDEQSLKGKRIKRAYLRTADGKIVRGERWNRSLKEISNRLTTGRAVFDVIGDKAR
jgi:hypothetical protein